ncbi:MAG: HypC/HybG/HupF family hydrogenase formation chaperone [Thaumarchaeota archaeon]|jgi:hydrogenase expression/formation protein HypC|nr:HypC/HybG/HupF family hydrogenase formation chaperone [Candidatus Geocrenenecus arthurdayi]MCL7388449.1 HypC/HybG/HupF family hydrogenase formation chaperone [Candidatus Geocrenenecus arthurdayi]MCL7390850.1 HypC/HybG/HupF family hydrogenase formation chaperone [Candidatus Geocrenenecus arthurdayi]MCL7396184.1 HypC/HybG/HupF family hydrogenase formation chaperone [Candidatus Geocrenenecus arthurdayi]MCL7401956.1 HypC/HybG/HupF family hydrogenase formation chaperone [Candidatus Geocrenenecus 
MCWGVYGKVVEVSNDFVKVDFGGIVKEVLSAVDDLSPGDYVIVHAGFIISKLKEEEFLDSFKYIREAAEKLVEEGELSIEEIEEMDRIVKRWLTGKG